MREHIFNERLEFTNIRELIEWAGEANGDKYAYSFKNNGINGDITKITFGQLRDDVRSLATGLRSMGCAGKHCVIIGRFSYQWALTYFATLCAGGVLVPLDPDWAEDTLADTVKKADGTFLFCDKEVEEKGKYIAEHTDLEVPPFILLDDDNERSFMSLVKSGKEKFSKEPEIYFDSPIDPIKMSLLVFTSGTTGKGKGVMLSQNAVLSNVSSMMPYFDVSEKTVGVLPPHHTYGSSAMLVGHITIVSEIYISSGIKYVQKELKEQKPGHLILVPLYLETFYRKIQANIKAQGKEQLVERMIKLSNALLKVGIDKRKTIFASIRAAFGGEVRTIITGGAPINQEIINFFESIGINVLNGYGITECAPFISANRSKSAVKGSVGTIIDIDTVKIDEPNEDGEGEILVKGPNVMLGYYKDAEATANAFKNGFFRTGDYGKLGKNNILYITGRKKNLIILSNGKNVYPEEIETELIAIPGVLEVIVYEGQSRRGLSYNTIVAEIYPDKDYIETNGIENVEAYFKEHVDNYNRNAVPYKKVGLIRVRKTEFPKNTLRKIMRFKLDMTIE